jgi:glycosyltransferase involved in cell wall biosynthesis
VKTIIQNFYQIPSERIEVVAHPTPDFSLPAMKHDIDIHDKYKIKGKILFYPAQFWPHKNHLILLKVLQSLIKKGNNEKKYIPGFRF